MENTPIEAFGYLRTSGHGNVGEGKDSDTRQRLTIQSYADSHGIEIVGWFYDQKVKGSDPIESRPGFSAMLTAIAANGARTILVETANRFSRDLMTQEAGFAHLSKLGITLVPVDAPDYFTGDDDPMRTAIRQMMGVMAQLEKATTVARLRGARQRKKALTGRCEGGKPAPEAARALAKDLRATGLPLRDIASRLAAEGFLSPSGRTYGPGSIKAMLKVVMQP